MEAVRTAIASMDPSSEYFWEWLILEIQWAVVVGLILAEWIWRKRKD